MRLETQNVEIKTAQVEIKVLTIKGRQVTLSVFRQLVEREILDFSEMKLNGTPWGWVNYLCDYSDGINVVWQDGTLLYRCEVSLYKYASMLEKRVRERAKELGLSVIRKRYNRDYWGKLLFETEETWFTYDNNLSEERYFEAQVLKISTEMAAEYAKDTYNTLKSLPQLFIAV